MRPVVFCGNSLAVIREYPKAVRQDIGFQLDSIQRGHLPDHWKPFRTIGKGVKEIRITSAGNYRVIILDARAEAIYVLHSFQKKSRKTMKSDIDHARKRLRGLGRNSG